MNPLLKSLAKAKVAESKAAPKFDRSRLRKIHYTTPNPDRTYGETQNGGFGPRRQYHIGKAVVSLSVCTGMYEKGHTDLWVELPGVFSMKVSNLRGDHEAKLDALLSTLTSHLEELKDIAAHAQVDLGATSATDPTQTTPEPEKSPGSTAEATADSGPRPQPNPLRRRLPLPGKR